MLKCKIIWKENCKFDLYINALSDTKLDKIDSLISSVPVTVKIMDIASQYYISEWKIKILDKELEGQDTIYFKSNK